MGGREREHRGCVPRCVIPFKDEHIPTVTSKCDYGQSGTLIPDHYFIVIKLKRS